MHVKGFALKTFEKFNIRKEREREKGERMRERQELKSLKEIETIPPLRAKNDKRRNYLFIATT